jgi:ABC-type uncharacterized transport system substrate-binding protein
MMSRKALCAAAFAGLGIIAHAGTASAHPHVYVTVESTVMYDKGIVTGIRQRWYFDEFYTAMAIEGLDANNDGVYDRTELAELAKVNVEGLGQMNYFTAAKLGDQPLAFDTPKDYWLDHVAKASPPGPAKLMEPMSPAPEAEKPSFWSGLVGKLTGGSKTAEEPAAKILALEFTLPLKQPVLAEAEGLTYSVYDPQFWIWFDLDTAKGAMIGNGAPKGCKAEVGAPKKDAADIQRLGEAFMSQAGGSQVGFGAAKTVSLSCPKQ